MPSQFWYRCQDCGITIKNSVDKYRHPDKCKKQQEINQSIIQVIDKKGTNRFQNIQNIQNIQNNIVINVHIPEGLTSVNPTLLKEIKDTCWTTLKNSNLGTQQLIEQHVKQNVYTLDEMKSQLSSLGMRPYLISILQKTKNMKPKEMIQPIKLLIEKSFSPDVLTSDGKFSFSDIAGLPFRIKPKAALCDVLGYDAVSPNVVWIQKRWKNVIYDLILFVGNCLINVMQDYHDTDVPTHPFQSWWDDKDIDSLSMNAQVQKFIKEIKERIESDCKDEMTAGYQTLIEICNNVYMEKYIIPEVEKPPGMLNDEEYENLLEERDDILSKFGVFTQVEKDRVAEINILIKPNRDYRQCQRRTKQELENSRQRSPEGLRRLCEMMSNRLESK